jgi:hypothetical protein
MKRPGKVQYAAHTFKGEGAIRTNPLRGRTILGDKLDAFEAFDALVEKTARKAIREQAEATLPKHAPRKRGRKPEVRDQVIAAMLADLRSGALTAEDLEAASETWLESQYKHSRDTCRRALDVALSEFRKQPFPTIDK